MNRIVLAVSLFAGALCYLEAQAQSRWYVGPHVGYGVGPYGGYGYGGATTPGSAAGHAMADMTRAQGAYNAMTSAAMINAEQARSKYIENQKQWTEVYMMKERVVQAEHARKLEEARARNARMREYRASNPSDLPPRLTSSELDPTTGKINWPSALMRDSFTVQRGEIETLFTSRALTGTTSETTAEINRKVRALQDALRGQIRQIVPQEYMAARKFLDRLALEGQFPVS